MNPNGNPHAWKGTTMNKKQMKRIRKDYKHVLKRIKKLDKRLDKDVLPVEDYRLMRAEYFALCSYEGLLRHRIEVLGIKL